MKFSIPIAILILTGAAAIGWNDQQRLAVAQQKHAKLVAEAAGLGIALDPSHPSDPIHVTKHERTDREADAKLAAKEFIAFAKEMEAMEKKGGPPDEAAQKRIIALMDRMMSLDAGQLKIVIAELRAAPDLKDETRQGLIGFSIMTLANDHPQAALALFTESSDLFKKNGMGSHVISASLSRWAKDDPAAALAWVRENGEKFPDLITDDAKRGLVAGAALNDPKLAFKLIGELGLKDAQDVSAIIQAAKTPEERSATLDALRAHLGTITDEKTRAEIRGGAIGSLASKVVDEGFQSATQWIEKAKLSPEELIDFANGLNSSNNNSDTGQWVEWVAEKLPDGKSDASIQQLVSEWTTNDYQAAGKWLGTMPAGPAKNVSIRSYAETISKYEPEAAAQWAMTLPAGKDRESTLQQIYQNWPKEDSAAEAAAAAFAKEHGIK